MFTERDAIQFELEELREQARRDDEFYLEVRAQRHQRYSALMDRLRQVDAIIHEEKESVPKPVELVLPSINFDEIKQENGGFLPLSKRSSIEERINKEMQARKTQRVYHSIEAVASKIAYYLEIMGESKLKDIQDYVQQELGMKWNNFTSTINRAMKTNPRIKRTDKKGVYFYDAV